MKKVAILGYGTIGSGVHEVLMQRDDFKVVRVLDLRDLTGTPAEGMTTTDFADIESDPEIEVVVETMGGTDPAYRFVKACLLKGKHVVTSNKNLVAAHGAELMQVAIDNGVHFLFEASVGGGIPIIRAICENIPADKVTMVSGILNGTTNYILTEMVEEGKSYAEALKEAQALGYAERDPSADVEGWDTCRKISIIASIVTGKKVDYTTVPTVGITGLTREDMLKAQEAGKVIKLIGSLCVEGDEIRIKVEPTLIEKGEILAGVRGVYNAVEVIGSNVGKLMFYGSGAGKLPTASAVVADVVHTADPIPTKPLWV